MKNKIYSYLVLFSGFLIVSYSVFIYFIAVDFTYAAGPSKENVIGYISVRIFIGIIYALAVILIARKQISISKILVFIFSVGFISRLILIPTEPILEDDFNRYLWDGAVSANGFNPYEYPPKLFLEKDSISNPVPQTLIKLAYKYQNIVEQINFPQIRTIYPPVAQATFAIAYFVKPFSVSIWKSLLLLLDLLVFYLLLKVLINLKLNPALVVIYWWNPILLHEIFNAGHMDLLLFPFIVGAILFYLKDKYIYSIVLFTFAVGVKIWPIIFIPFVLKKVWQNKKVFILASLITVVIVFIILYPILITKLDGSLGFVAYSNNWTNNESLFRLIDFIVEQLISFFKLEYHNSLSVTRWIVIFMFATLIIFQLFKSEKNKSDMIKNLFYLIAIMYLISPTQFPWYYTWVLPLLVMKPRLSFVAYAILLPLYQLKYFWNYLVWIEHIPIIILFITEMLNLKFSDYLVEKSKLINS